MKVGLNEIVAWQTGRRAEAWYILIHTMTSPTEHGLPYSFTWILDGTRVMKLLGTGHVVATTAAEIFQAEFGRTSRSNEAENPTPSASLPDLGFSRNSAPVAIRVFNKDHHINAVFGVLTEQGFVHVGPDTDQLVFQGCWYPIHHAALASACTWAATLGIHAGEITIGALVAVRAASDRPCELLDEVTATASTLSTAFSTPPETIAGLVANLYDYQKSGISFLRVVAEQEVGCILGDEMGLGKTLQIIALLQAQLNASQGPSLVVAPATLLVNWQREIAQFAPQLTVRVHAGAERAGIARHLGKENVTLVSYETAIRDEVLLSAVAWNVIALDEAQNIKNPSALRTLAVKRLSRRVSVAVTGTPLENSLDDLWSITDFALPGLLGSLREFRSQFANGIPDATRLAPIVAPVLLRRMVADVAQDLPEKIEIPQALEMSPKLAAAYEEVRKSALEEFGPAGCLVATSRLRMLCAHPSLVIPWAVDPAMDMPKYVRTMELLEEIFSQREKVLVFSTYQGIADLFMADVPRRFPAGFCRFIDGRIAVSERQFIVDGFFAFDGPGVLFLNPKAAGSGLNITAANHVIHYNNEWNPAITAQASARAFRRRQTRPVTIHHLFYVNTIEEVIRDVSLFKQTLAMNAVVGHDGDVSPLQMARALQISPFANRD